MHYFVMRYAGFPCQIQVFTTFFRLWLFLTYVEHVIVRNKIKPNVCKPCSASFGIQRAMHFNMKSILKMPRALQDI